MTESAFSRAAVAAPHLLAAEAGRDVFAQGGNAIEAMVAMAASIAVVYPHMNAIGGDGFWLIRDGRGKSRAIEACGFAGQHATIAHYEKIGGIPTRGPQAALTVPGAIGGWAQALELSKALGGKLPLGYLLERAEKQAREGVPVSLSEARTEAKDRNLVLAAPGYRETYYIDGEPAKAGAIRRQLRLADTLSQLAHAGLEDFYRGDIGREIAADLEAIESPVTRADLKAYEARFREPLTVRLNAATLYNTPVPTQGLASLILLGIWQRLGSRDVEGAEHAHALIEASKRALAIRDRACVDFDIAMEDFDHLLSSTFLDGEAFKIDKTRAAAWPLPADKGDTIWMGAVDSGGISVSYIQSIYWEYGSGCVLPHTGVLMQNRGIAFSLDPRSPRALKPGRRPFHTLNPALAVFDDGRVMPYGSMGGDGQPQFQAQVFTRILAGESLEKAVAAPRWLWGRAWGDTSVTLKIEAAFDDGLASKLSRMGHEIERKPENARDLFGHAGALRRGLKGEIEAAHDPRADGGAMGF